jgi:hypothetical protein
VGSHRETKSYNKKAKKYGSSNEECEDHPKGFLSRYFSKTEAVTSEHKEYSLDRQDFMPLVGSPETQF